MIDELVFRMPRRKNFVFFFPAGTKSGAEARERSLESGD